MTIEQLLKPRLIALVLTVSASLVACGQRVSLIHGKRLSV